MSTTWRWRKVPAALVLAAGVVWAQAGNPAETKLRALAAAASVGDEAQAKAWVEANFSAEMLKRAPAEELARHMARAGKQAGGFDVVKVDVRGPAEAEITLKAKRVPLEMQMIAMVEAESPHRILRWGMRPVGAPLDTAALKALPAGATQEQKLAAIATAVDKAGRDGKFSGTFLVARNGEVLLEKAYGFAEKSFQVKNAMDTRFHIGSMPKMFTSVAIAQLAQAGRLSYADTMAKWLPDYPNQEVAKKVTIHQLLTHTSGLSDYFGPEFDRKKGDIRKLEDYYQFFASKPLRFEPGTSWSYSNAGMHVAGIIVQRASGMDYYEYLRKNVFGPAGMKDTDSDRVEEVTPNLAVGYTREGSEDELELEPPSRNNILTLPPQGGPAGGGYSTARDLLKFAQALIGHKLLDAKHTELVTAGKVKVPWGPDAQYGYGFEDGKVNGKRVIGHGGGAPGMNAMLRVMPESGYVVAALSNYDPPVAQMLAQQAAEALARD